MEILLMCLLGVAVTWGVVEAVRSDDDTPPVEPEPEPEQPENGSYMLTDDEVLYAGTGDDTISAAAGVDNVAVYGGAGQDSISLSADDSLIRGGSGDDLIELFDSENTIVQGDGGNDTIFGRGNEGVSYYGGAGHDLIDVIFEQGSDDPTLIDGGFGNDTIAATISTDGREVDALPPRLTGGPGSNLFELDIVSGANVNYFPDGEAIARQPLAVITDFVKGQDELVIDPLANGSIEPNILRSYQFYEAADSSYTDVRLTYDTNPGSPDGMEGYTVFVRLEGASGLTEDDIEVIGGTPLPPVGPQDGHNYEVRSGDRITAGPGNDRFEGDDLENVNIIAGPGDDLAYLHGTNIQVRGGEGNDTIHIGGQGLIVHGGGGDDWLYLHDAGTTQAYGGDGNDLFTADFGSDGSYGGSLQGGDGDDRFEVTLMTHDRDELGVQPALIYGGAGADHYEFSVYADEDNDDGVLPEPPRPIAVIADFVQGQDRVVIEPRLNDSQADEPTFTGMVFRGDLIVLQYAVPPAVAGGAPTVQEEWIRLTGVTQITGADVSLAAPAA